MSTDSRDDKLFHVAAGGLAALTLGAALTPLREVTPAANLAFAFVILTIVLGELGGSLAATVTALMSALSLDFFLTKPYLRLAIEEKDDLIAFLGLAACGMVAAAFASRRGRRKSDLQATHRDLDLLHSALRRLEAGAPSEEELEHLLDAWRGALPVSALTLRDTRGYVVAASSGAHGSDVPAVVLNAETLAPSTPGAGLRSGAEPLPLDGGRLALVAQDRPVGWLDVWGDGGLVDTRTRRTLTAVARVAATLLAMSSAAQRPVGSPAPANVPFRKA